jgi:hypothetical protein
MRINNKKLFIDLKYFSFGCHSLALNYEEMVDEFWKNNIFSDHGLPAGIRIPTVRRAIFRQLQNQKFFLLGSVFKYGVRAAYLQRRLARYSGVLACGKTKDLSHGHSGQDFPQHAGPCQSDKRLAIYADFAQTLIKKARLLYADDSFGIELEQTIYALDATTIDLCLSLFPWAVFRKHKGAVRLHTLLDLRGNIPTVAFITSGKVHEVNILDKLSIETGHNTK